MSAFVFVGQYLHLIPKFVEYTAYEINKTGLKYEVYCINKRVLSKMY